MDTSANTSIDADTYVKQLNMFQLPCEMYLGYFYNSSATFDKNGAKREMASGAYCLYKPHVKIDLHKQEFDEIIIAMHGCALDVATILPDGTLTRHVLGKNVLAGEKLTISVPAGSFMGVANRNTTEFSLISAFTAPAFERTESIFYTRKQLLEMYPQHEETILEFSSEDIVSNRADE